MCRFLACAGLGALLWWPACPLHAAAAPSWPSLADSLAEAARPGCTPVRLRQIHGDLVRGAAEPDAEPVLARWQPVLAAQLAHLADLLDLAATVQDLAAAVDRRPLSRTDLAEPAARLARDLPAALAWSVAAEAQAARWRADRGWSADGAEREAGQRYLALASRLAQSARSVAGASAAQFARLRQAERSAWSARGAGLLELLPPAPAEVRAADRRWLTDTDAMTPAQAGRAAALAALGLLVGLLARRRIRRRAVPWPASGLVASGTRAALLATSGHLPGLAAFAGLVTYLSLASRWPALSPYLLVGELVLAWLTFRALAHGLAHALAPTDDATATLLVRLPSVVAVAGLARLCSGLGERAGLPPALADLGWTVGLLAVTVDLARRSRRWAQRERRRRLDGWLSHGATAVLSLAGLLLLAGFDSLACHLLAAVIWTVALRLAVAAALVALEWLQRTLGAAGHDGCGRLRAALHLAPEAAVPGTRWLFFGLRLALWSAAAGALLGTWLPAESAGAVRRWAETGSIWGGLSLPLSRIIGAALAFSWLLAAAQVLQAALAAYLQRRSDLDDAARAALVTIGGYLGALVAGLAAAACLGLDATRLTFVASALSVGIGFGLQNIVNNFVSGLILLLERPIGVGDWVRLGDLEGRVERLSVRSTQLRTAALEAVIVPNSDLITRQVINLSRLDPRGRIAVPFRVAYGADVDELSAAVVDLASAHPEVVDNVPGMPATLLRSFGDGALNLELRCVIAEVSHTQVVASDLSFQIAKLLRARQVAVPFAAPGAWPVAQTEAAADELD